MSTRHDRSFDALREVATAAGLATEGAEPIRLAENDLWRLPGGIVVRIARPGQDAAASREVAVARWLAEQGVPAVRPLPLDQPVRGTERCATFWEELPRHRAGTAADLAPLLRRLHELPLPALSLGRLDPFVRIDKRIGGAQSIDDHDRRWLLARLHALRKGWADLPSGRGDCVVHGDAWGGNCAVLSDGTSVLLDFERTSIGPPEWDLAAIAVEYETFGTLPARRYRDFCHFYGADVMIWPGYPLLRDIRELRKVSFAIQIADENPNAAVQARYRIECIRGMHGARPWNWSAVA